MTTVAIMPMMILFLFAVIAVTVLFIKLCSKRPWIGGFMALGILSLFVLVFLFWGLSYDQEVATPAELYSDWGAVEFESKPAAIWQPGIEDEFKANVYPSKLSAVRSLGLRIGEPIRQFFGDQAWPNKGILFQGSHDPDVLDELIKTIARKFPQTQWTVAPETVGVQPDEVGIRLDLSAFQTGPAPWNSGNSGSRMTRGTIRASVLAGNRQTSINAEFVEKPWIENFYGVWNNRPNTRMIIAKSTESCLTQAEANSQAIGDACNQLTQLLQQTPMAQATLTLARNVTANDVLEGDFIVDRFAQNFDGRAGKIWRQALLLDASIGKLEKLAHHKAAVAKAVKWTWARMLGSVFGLLVLITVVYAFLNAATKGYYAWSLRIAGAVLAVAVIILFVA